MPNNGDRLEFKSLKILARIAKKVPAGIGCAAERVVIVVAVRVDCQQKRQQDGYERVGSGYGEWA